ncbi:Rha family transcriptional regulator [Macrococcoides caseolyticum]|uniref:Rha family transcriptional regulator n=1 Tax=Macrococcoides caseolyticum TaxID=69966 RepID=UPI001F241075|nr:Rha family transcriptional regulator [Macrococcus caseolyticus]MCE4957687.1 ORF6C domain-containing protein [Macrococcus caseolyticus]
MNNLIKIEKNKDLGLVVSSRTVAEELNRQHQHVKRDLDKILMSPDVDVLIFKSEYKDSRGRTQEEYLLTKDGFTLYMFNIQGHNDFKMAYINRFNEMEQAIKENNIQLPSDPMEVLELMFNANKQTNEKVNKIEAEVIDLKENQKLDAGEYNLIGKRVTHKVLETIKNYNLVNNRKVKKELYRELNNSINRITNIRTRTQLKQKHFDVVLDFINSWTPSNATLYLVRQMDLDEMDGDQYANS